jgi:hypothetical protein
LLLVCSALTPPVNAAAEDRCQATPSCRKQTVAATQLAAQNHCDEAIPLYEKAYAQSQEPRLLLNIGRCHHRLGQPRQALERYEEFRRVQPSPQPELLSRLNQFIAESKLAILTAEKEAAKPAPAVEVEPPPAPIRPRWDGKTLFGRPLWRVGVGFGVAAVGGVLIGLGIGALSVNGSCVESSVNFAGKCAAELDAEGARSAMVVDGITPGVPMLVTGLLFLAGGVTLVALPPRKPRSALLSPAALRGGWSLSAP